MQPGCTRLAYMGPKMRTSSFLLPFFVTPKTIPRAPWSYPENLEVIDAPIPQL